MTAAVATHRVGQVLAQTKAEGRAALIGYLPVGFPDVETSIAAMRVLVEVGVDIIEVGMPYSDPLMDGPVIAHAAQSALQAGVKVADAFTAVQAVAEAGAPALVMTYWNVVERFGVADFASRLAQARGAGLITPDLIPDEADAWLAAAEQHDLDRIFLVAPSSTPTRLAATAAACRGFVYAASTMGVTGARDTVGTPAHELVARLRAVSDQPVCVGLGVSTPAQAAEISAYAEGVIVGSALVKCLAQATSPAAGLAELQRVAGGLVAGVRGGRA